MSDDRPRLGSTAALVCVALILASGIAGCYTMLRHPEAGPGRAAEADGCSRCHDRDEPLEVFASPLIDYYGYSSSPWINYYGAPWWHGSAWERCRSCDGSEASPEDPGFVLSGRQGWGRRVRPAATDTAEEDPRTRGAEALLPMPIVSPPAIAPGVPVLPSSPPAQAPVETEKPKEEEKKPERPRGFRR